MNNTQIGLIVIALGFALAIYLIKGRNKSPAPSTPVTPVTPPVEDIELVNHSKMTVAQLKTFIKSKGKVKNLPTKKADLVSLADELWQQDHK